MFIIKIWFVRQNALGEHLSLELQHAVETETHIRLVEACLIIDRNLNYGLEGATRWGLLWLTWLLLGHSRR